MEGTVAYASALYSLASQLFYRPYSNYLKISLSKLVQYVDSRIIDSQIALVLQQWQIYPIRKTSLPVLCMRPLLGLAERAFDASYYSRFDTGIHLESWAAYLDWSVPVLLTF